MKKQIITAIAVLSMVGFAQAATITYNFDDADGAVDSNTFGSGVTAGDWTEDVDEGGFAFQNGRAESGMRTDGAEPTPYPVNSFTIDIPAGTTADLTELSFDVGFNETIHPNEQTPGWSLAISQGTTSDPDMSGNLPLVVAAGYTFENKVITLTGLTGLTDTTVTFDFTLTMVGSPNNSLARANTMDNVVLTGTATALADPPAIIHSFSADSTNVFSGETVTLSWSTANEDTLTLNPGSINVTGQTSSQVTVTADTTYELIAANAFGSDTNEVLVTLITTPPVIQTFTASASDVLSGSMVEFSWDVDDVTGLTLDPGGIDVMGLLSTQLVVDVETTYILTATNPFGSTNAPVTVSVFEVSDSTVISINFDDGSRAIEEPLGAVVATHWNLADFGTSASPVTTVNLLLSTGEASTAALELSNRDSAKPARGMVGERGGFRRYWRHGQTLPLPQPGRWSNRYGQ